MQVVLNGEKREVADDTTVAALLEELNLQPRRVAVEVNRDLVPRATFAETQLREGDAIEVVTFVGGG